VYYLKSLAKWDKDELDLLPPPQTREERIRNRILGRLLALGIEPYKNEEVEAYKQQVFEKDRRAEKFWTFFSGETVEDFFMRVFGGTVLGCLTTIAFAMRAHETMGDIATAGLGGFFLGLVTSLVFFVLASVRMGSYHNSRWERATFTKYSRTIGAVPADVWAGMYQIREALPTVNIHVDYFKNDPFVVLEEDDVEVYTLGWDEDDFEPTRS
jgi:hypothetical protein